MGAIIFMQHLVWQHHLDIQHVIAQNNGQRKAPARARFHFFRWREMGFVEGPVATEP